MTPFSINHLYQEMGLELQLIVGFFALMIALSVYLLICTID